MRQNQSYHAGQSTDDIDKQIKHLEANSSARDIEFLNKKIDILEREKQSLKLQNQNLVKELSIYKKAVFSKYETGGGKQQSDSHQQSVLEMQHDRIVELEHRIEQLTHANNSRGFQALSSSSSNGLYKSYFSQTSDFLMKTKELEKKHAEVCRNYERTIKDLKDKLAKYSAQQMLMANNNNAPSSSNQSNKKSMLDPVQKEFSSGGSDLFRYKKLGF